MEKKYIWLYLALVSISSICVAETIPFSDDAWEFSGKEIRVETVGGQEALFVKNGRAMLKDVVFQNGTLEFDMMNDGSRGFSGAYWRMSISEILARPAWADNICYVAFGIKMRERQILR